MIKKSQEEIPGRGESRQWLLRLKKELDQPLDDGGLAEAGVVLSPHRSEQLKAVVALIVRCRFEHPFHTVHAVSITHSCEVTPDGRLRRGTRWRC